MPRGPRGERRPANVNARAVMIGKIATGEIEDVTTDDGKNAAAVALGRMGGCCSARSGAPCSPSRQVRHRPLSFRGNTSQLGPNRRRAALLDLSFLVHPRTTVRNRA
jgi:hypothetical protein